MKPSHKRLNIVLASLLVILIVFITVLAVKNKMRKLDLLTDGIRTEAQVYKMYEETTLKGKTKKWYIEIALFEDIKKGEKNIQTSKTEPANVSDKIDAIFDTLNSNKSVLGDFQIVRLSISQHNYGAIKLGDWKTYVYKAGEIQDGILLDELE